MKRFEQMKSLYNRIIQDYTSKCLNNIEVAGLTMEFDMLFELTWKTLKDYMYNELGILQASTGSPKIVLRLAYSSGIIEDESVWLQILHDRNDDTHHYNESVARTYASRIQRDYLQRVAELISKLRGDIPDDENALVKIPKEFLKLHSESGLYYDEFLKQTMDSIGITDEVELFRNWEKYYAKLNEMNMF